MGFPQRYQPSEAERRWQDTWAEAGIYRFDPDDPRPIFAIDTPPPTVSGEIHIGHVYSYVQAEAMVRFWRMQGLNVYYPFGFDDNGLPTERYVERALGIRARDLSRSEFIAACLQSSHAVEDRFEIFWKSLGMSVDWRLRYSTIDPESRRVSQWSFIDLHRKGRIYREQAPNPWCVECQTAIAQAEMEDAERTTTFWTLDFGFATNDAEGPSRIRNPKSRIPIATTRPELLAACVAVFVHPDDARYRHLAGGEAITPLFGRRVPILADPAVDPEKGSGAVMCCTFGDATDVAWWRSYGLPLIPLLTRQGTLGADAGPYAALTTRAARERIVADLRAAGALLDERAAGQTVRVHERCGTPLEILETSQWFVRILDVKEELLAAGRRIRWHPSHMLARYEHWVQNLNWDWCISRQRFYGVPFPVWHCDRCGAAVLADEAQLPVDPTSSAPPRACDCGNESLRPDEDVMDTWATSSVSPQIAALRWRAILGGRAGEDGAGDAPRGSSPIDDPMAARLFPMQLRPQAHDIIRTWAFYTIVKSHFHFGQIPWETVAISGHALDPAGRKFSKSKGNAPVVPSELVERYGADAVRYWACGGALGADQPLNEDAMRQGTRLVTKLWNASRFIAGHLAPAGDGDRRLEVESGNLKSPISSLQPADRALLSWLQRLIGRATAAYRSYDYAGARDMVERFFWGTFCDNYLELVKGRLYDGSEGEREAARSTLATTLLAVLKLLAPILPHITEEIYSHLFASRPGDSIHIAPWPEADPALVDDAAEQVGEAILALAGAVRRYKSGRQLGLGTPLALVEVGAAEPALRAALAAAASDLRSVTRAALVEVAAELDGAEELPGGLRLRIER